MQNFCTLIPFGLSGEQYGNCVFFWLYIRQEERGIGDCYVSEELAPGINNLDVPLGLVNTPS